MKELMRLIEKIAISISKVNTNNAWGFGGAIKTVYHLSNGTSVHKGKVCYRHAPSTTFINLRDSNGNILLDGKKKLERYFNLEGKLQLIEEMTCQN